MFFRDLCVNCTASLLNEAPKCDWFPSSHTWSTWSGGLNTNMSAAAVQFSKRDIAAVGCSLFALILKLTTM